MVLISNKLLFTPRRVECVPPKPMVIYVDNNGGQGKWLRLFIEVLLCLLATFCDISSSLGPSSQALLAVNIVAVMPMVGLACCPTVWQFSRKSP